MTDRITLSSLLPTEEDRLFAIDKALLEAAYRAEQERTEIIMEHNPHQFRNDKCNEPSRLSYSLPKKHGLPVAVLWFCVAVTLGVMVWVGW